LTHEANVGFSTSCRSFFFGLGVLA
jgi:hypothetical protein